MAETHLKVAVIDENHVRAAILEDGLRMAGYSEVTVISEMTSLLRRLVDLEPDVVIIDLENPSRDVLEQMFQVSRVFARSVSMFVDQSDPAMTDAAIDAGVSAYIFKALTKDRLMSTVPQAVRPYN